jgi:UTP--glucose-1-phosphate uridylyltransferase
MAIKKRDIKKAVIPIAGLGTRFLPLSKIIPKEFFPLNSKPIIQYIIDEALQAGAKELIFVVSPEKKEIFKDYILKYFQEERKLISILRKRKKKQAIKALREIPKIKYKYIIQKKPLGDGDAILRAERLINGEPFLVLFGDDVSFGKEGIASQLAKVFKKTGKPLFSFYKMPKKKLSSYGVPKVKKIKERLYRVEDLIEKPKGTPPSNFAIVGKYVLTPDIFFYLKKTATQYGEIILLNALKEKIRDKKEVWGIEVEGKWLECGDIEKWKKSFIYLAKKRR